MPLEQIKEITSDFYRGDSTGHDFYHAERVYNLGMKIGEGEKADRLVVGAAAYLHDLFRPLEKEKGINYHVSPEALDLINKLIRRTDFPSDKIPAVLLAVSLHEEYSFGVHSGKQNILEGLVLQDADRLDAIGAIGIARCFAFGGHYGRPIYLPEKSVEDGKYGSAVCNPAIYDPAALGESAIQHFHDKLLKIKDSLNTNTGKRIAEGRHIFMEKYLGRFYKEWDGEQ